MIISTLPGSPAPCLPRLNGGRGASLCCFPIHKSFHDEEADHPAALLMFQDLSQISLISCIFPYVPYFVLRLLSVLAEETALQAAA